MRRPLVAFVGVVLLAACSPGATMAPNGVVPPQASGAVANPTASASGTHPSTAVSSVPSFDPFATLPYELTLPPDWYGAANADDWAKAVAAYDIRYPGALSADSVLRTWPSYSRPDPFVALRADGAVLLVNSEGLAGLTPEQALSYLEANGGTLLYGGATPPPDSHLIVKRLDLPAGPAITISGTSPHRVPGVAMQRVAYLIPAGQSVYALVFDFRASTASTLMPRIIEITQSFRLRSG